VTGGWRKLHNEELHNLYSSPNIIRTIKSRRMIWAGNVARMGKKITSCGILFGKADVKKPLGISKRRWKNNKLDFREIGGGSIEWTDLAQDRNRRVLVNTAMNFRLP
jgi:hypothetical protein